MPATAITGKSVTWTYGSTPCTVQTTTVTVDEKGDSSTVQTLGGSVTVAQGVESTVSADLLYDGEQPGGGIYGALKAALDASSSGTLTITTGADAQWTGSALVTSLSAEMPADDAVTASVEFAVSGTLAFTPAPVAP
mgnify:CR=1 FL=1